MSEKLSRKLSVPEKRWLVAGATVMAGFNAFFGLTGVSAKNVDFQTEECLVEVRSRDTRWGIARSLDVQVGDLYIFAADGSLLGNGNEVETLQPAQTISALAKVALCEDLSPRSQVIFSVEPTANP